MTITAHTQAFQNIWHLALQLVSELIVKTTTDLGQILEIKNLLKNSKQKALIITDAPHIKHALIRLLFNGPELQKIMDIESELAFFSDFLAIIKSQSITNIVNIAYNPITKPELSAGPSDTDADSLLGRVAIKEAVEQTKNCNSLPEALKIWAKPDSPRPKLIEPFLDQISSNRQEFVTSLYSNISSKNIHIAHPEEIRSVSSPDILIITNANKQIYDSVVPYLSEQNLDIMPSDIKQADYRFFVSGNIMSAKKTILINNAQHKNISSLVLYYQSQKNTQQQTWQQSETRQHAAKKTITAFADNPPHQITPSALDKLSKNPFYFYLEHVLRLKKIYRIKKHKISPKNFKRAVLNVISPVNNYQTSKLDIMSRYKALKDGQRITKALEEQMNIKNIDILNAEPIKKSLEGIEITIYPDFAISSKTENSAKQFCFYTKKNKGEITGGTDQESRIISLCLENVIFIKSGSDIQITQVQRQDPDLLSQLISSYKAQKEYQSTPETEGLSKEYQQISRYIIIKDRGYQG